MPPTSSVETLSTHTRNQHQEVMGHVDGTYARKSAPVLALGPFWRQYLKWLPPTRLSQQEPMSEFPKSFRSSMV